MANMMSDTQIASYKARMNLPSGRFWLIAFCVPVLAFLFLPILVVLPLAFTNGQILMFPPTGFSVRHFGELFADRQWTSAAIDSFKVALTSTVIAAVVGSCAAIALDRSALPGKHIITTVLLLPMLVPAIVVALGFYMFFLQFGMTGQWTTIALAHSVVCTPYVFVAVQASLTGLDPSLVRAVRSLGGGNLAVATNVYWPAALPGVLGGSVFAFIGSFDEIIIAHYLSGSSVETLPVRMFTSLQQELTPKVAAVSALLFLLSILALSAQVMQLRSRVQKHPGQKAK